MLAADTDVVVRLLTEDDPKQAAIARSIFADNEVWISKTVLLETAWVLKSVPYRFDPKAIIDVLARLVALPNVTVEDRPAVERAIDLVRNGVDLADALHYESRSPGIKFVSFDAKFVRRARQAGSTDIEQAGQD